MNLSPQPLFSAADIARRVEELAGDIAPHLGDDPLVLGILKGGFMFCADLCRALSRRGVQPQIEFMAVSSYGSGTVSSGTLRVLLEPPPPRGRTVLVVEDILDSGNTLNRLTLWLQEQGAARVLTCTLLDKPSRRQVAFSADFVGFIIPDHFVVGYGIDYAERHRELPYIGTVQTP
ncbi:MAG: hypoxanthine phosphoribosyltransferase [Magnetococcus sp. WYHC-3]